MELDSAAKKPRMEEAVPVTSRVLHIRNLPSDATEADVFMLMSTYGAVSKVLLLRQKNQAFVELAELSTACALVDAFSTRPAQIKDRTVYIQFSKHQELKSGSTPIANPGGVPTFTSTVGVVGTSQGQPNSILRVIIENMIYPITIDVLHQIFAKYGDVLKVVTFMKNTQFHALIQYPNEIIATNAKTALDGQNIYNGCCTLHIDYSKLSNLTVKFNNEKTRDFTRPDLPSGDPEAAPLPDLSAYGLHPAFLQSPAFAQLRTALTALGGTQGAAGAGVVAPTPVVLASNLNDKMISPHALFILFGVYGDVMRVKILYSKRDSALVQFREAQQAQNAVTHLNGCMLYGKKLHLTLSKHTQVQMPQPGSNEDALTEDFTNSPLHRFKKPGSKNYQNIYPPSPTLHLSNIPDGITEEYLRGLFTSTGGTVVNFRFFQNDQRMALVQMSSPDEAISALIVTHNHKISETNHLRVTFSKSNI
uniref:RRM domain-containing protein n=2 Tax=Amphimedon queenslandica TaxID=400682 RepID=A0A1X7UYZ1_AMPQE